MQNSKKTIVITILIWAGFIPYCSFAASTSDTKSKHPTAFELLDRYAAGLNRSGRRIATSSMQNQSTASTPYGLTPNMATALPRRLSIRGLKYLRFGRPRSSYTTSDDASSFFVENVRFENIEGVWVPMEADYRIVSERQNRTSTMHSHHKISQIDIDPNHTELQSFVLDVQNGTRVKSVGTPGFEYKWHDGKKFVVDEWDGSIRYVPKKWSLLVGVGKPLPQLEGIKLNLSSEQTKNRAILLCFFDMNQRPSRHCIRQLAQKAAELKEMGVTVAAVQTSQATENTLNEWTKKNNIPFTVGAITMDIEKTRFAWGVRALPWLILTDPDHTVCAEGFDLAELDEKISAIAQKQN